MENLPKLTCPECQSTNLVTENVAFGKKGTWNYWTMSRIKCLVCGCKNIPSSPLTTEVKVLAASE